VIGIAEIADELEMSRSTTHRYMMTLTEVGYLEQTPNRRYRLGLRVTDLGMAALSSAGLQEHAEYYLHDLRKRTGYTTSLAVLDGSEIIYIEHVRSYKRGQYEIDHNIRVGSRLPAYCTAMGKVLLAELPKSVQDELVHAMDLKRRGPHTITSKKALRAELESVKESGIAISNEELYDGLISIAVTVQDESHATVAAVDLAAHTSMISLEEMVDALGPHLISTADQISARLGYRREEKAPR
jgi:IclR family pca regulon transcriptional regulator